MTPRSGTSLYYAIHAAPLAQQPQLSAWVRWWHEVSAIPLSVSDPAVAQSKLGWWAQEVQQGFEGRAQHSLTQALLAQDHSHAPPQALWLEQIAGLQDLVQQNRWMDEATLRRHALATTGAACEGAAYILGVTSEQALMVSRSLGWGLRQAHMLARLGQDARNGWLHVPISILQAHDVKAHELLRPIDQQPPQHWPALLAHLHQQARQTLSQGIQAMSELPAPQRQALRPLRVLATLNTMLIDEIARSGSLVLRERIVLTPLRKWWGATRVQYGLT